MDAIRGSVAAGTPVCGAWISLGNTQSIEIMGKSGYDFLILDTQHGGITWDQLLPALQVLGSATPALVRVPWRDPAQIMRAADLGAAGVIVPMISTAEEARQAVAAIRYPPQGIRSFGPVRSYYTVAAEPAEPLCFVMVETAEAMQNLDAIAATPGLDGIFVGPVDLALSLGCGAAMKMPPPVLDAIDQIVSCCNKYGIIAGCASLGMDNAEDLLNRGVNLVAIGSDFAFLRNTAAANAEAGKKLKTRYTQTPANTKPVTKG